MAIQTEKHSCSQLCHKILKPKYHGVKDMLKKVVWHNLEAFSPRWSHLATLGHTSKIHGVQS